MKISQYSDNKENRLIELSYDEFTALHKIIKVFAPISEKYLGESLQERENVIEHMTDIFEFCASVGAVYQAMKIIGKVKP